jgi:cytochrome P450
MAFLLIGGHETTVNLLSTAVLALLRSPGQGAQLHADPATAVHELLRYEPPVGTATLRFTTEPVELGGVELPPGSFLLVSRAAANRDPERFTDPDRLDVTRGDRCVSDACRLPRSSTRRATRCCGGRGVHQEA